MKRRRKSAARVNGLAEVAREVSTAALRRDGPIIDVTLHAKCADDRPCEPVRGKALIDTGADRTAVERSALDRAGAMPAGVYHAQGATSDHVMLPSYPLRVELDGLGAVDLERVAGTPHLKSQGLLALIGRDVLQDSKMTYDGPSGAFTLSTADASTKVTSSGVTPLAIAGAVALVAVGAAAAWLLVPDSDCKR